jgi:hypothetical protein
MRRGKLKRKAGGVEDSVEKRRGSGLMEVMGRVLSREGVRS